MGGDQIVVHIAGDEVERQPGSALRDIGVKEFGKMIDEVQPFEELTGAGPARMFESLREFADNLYDTPLARPER
jgi:hypothetical protein